MSYHLFVDDRRAPPGPEWIWARSLSEAQTIITAAGSPLCLSLDDDLASSAASSGMLVDWLLCRAQIAAAHGAPIDHVSSIQVHGAGPNRSRVIESIRDFIRWVDNYEKQTQKAKNELTHERAAS